MEAGNNIMLLATECYHTMHKICFKDYAIRQMTTVVPRKGNSRDVEFNKVTCPKPDCKKVVPDFEIKD